MYSFTIFERAAGKVSSPLIFCSNSSNLDELGLGFNLILTVKLTTLS
ncbi:hypothetical protein DFQ04_1515 [Algoriphagus boseongensis]|uniref:Uncharacterized protein n=1 Tax=Algoriphagus boseongensis TaxID=1442587 RepID=A0A4R6T9C9_9BACT|nr:hypothetical protein DFQ04_1515 [Algoriphagus boseongensis]